MSVPALTDEWLEDLFALAEAEAEDRANGELDADDLEDYLE